jgi:hypothetical protein
MFGGNPLMVHADCHRLGGLQKALCPICKLFEVHLMPLPFTKDVVWHNRHTRGVH